MARGGIHLVGEIEHLADVAEAYVAHLLAKGFVTGPQPPRVEFRRWLVFDHYGHAPESLLGTAAEAAPPAGPKRSRVKRSPEEVSRVLNELGGNKSATARNLGLSQRTIGRYLKRSTKG